MCIKCFVLTITQLCATVWKFGKVNQTLRFAWNNPKSTGCSNQLVIHKTTNLLLWICMAWGTRIPIHGAHCLAGPTSPWGPHSLQLEKRNPICSRAEWALPALSLAAGLRRICVCFHLFQWCISFFCYTTESGAMYLSRPLLGPFSFHVYLHPASFQKVSQ